SSFIFSANSPIVFKDIDGRKFVNPYSDLLNDAEQKALKAESIYNDLKANKVSGEELRDAKRNIKDAQSSLASLMIKNNIANDLINTLELSNKREFDYFETLKNPDGKDVNIIVNVENMQGPKISGPNGVSYINANVEANWG